MFGNKLFKSVHELKKMNKEEIEEFLLEDPTAQNKAVLRKTIREALIQLRVAEEKIERLEKKKEERDEKAQKIIKELKKLYQEED